MIIIISQHNNKQMRNGHAMLSSLGSRPCSRLCSMLCLKLCYRQCFMPCFRPCFRPCSRPCSRLCSKLCSKLCSRTCSILCSRPCCRPCSRPCSRLHSRLSSRLWSLGYAVSYALRSHCSSRLLIWTKGQKQKAFDHFIIIISEISLVIIYDAAARRTRTRIRSVKPPKNGIWGSPKIT